LNRDTIIQQDILKALAYFDIFRYPLTLEEITFFLHSPAEMGKVFEQMLLLQRAGRIFATDGFFMLQDDASLAARRKKGNQLAAEEMKKAARTAKWLCRFPYVRSIAVSGSLSKNYADEHTDIDFFVITAGGRLWIARTLLHSLYKLLWLAGKRRWFCLNYYIDDAVMEIEEKNIFTATEIVTLKPLEGAATFWQFAAANAWVKQYYPQYKTIDPGIPTKRGLLKRLSEALLNNRLGNWLEQRLMQATKRRWQQKMLRNAVNEKGIKISMKADAHYAKPDPEHFQRNIIRLYEERVRGVVS
jgi:predicted nucleotidyltransferase